MKISAFTMVRNAGKYYFPAKESILSILPIVDEFIIALGDNDNDDTTRQLIESINSDKIKIYDRVWSNEDYVNGKILATETNFALSKCTGDWCFYLQADEVIHEKDHETILKACKDNLNNKHVDGLLFKYYHFWADYDHYLPFHGWYRNEIRIVRNHANIYSIKDAQSFRKEGNQKLNVVEIDAHVYHYGWVRPPELMQSKKKEQDTMYHDSKKIEDTYKFRPNEFNYGALAKIPTFKGTHPAVMKTFIEKISWLHKLNYTSKAGDLNRPLMKHERFKYRLISFIENTLLGGKDLFGYSNWHKLK